MSDTFVENPLTVLKVGQEVKARVLEVDISRKRIALSLKSEEGKTKVSGSQNRSPSNQNSHTLNSNQSNSNKRFNDEKNNPFAALKGLKL